MCGIAGAWSPRKDSGREALEALGRRMGQAIAHRGPDDSGTWTDPAAGVVLAHRRLSILDLSPEGHQPMVSADGRWVLAFNGEIYNHHPLRQALAALGHRFNGHSDTEVLLAAIAQWGVHEALERGNGMLALAAWDRQQQVLWLARDRVGKKPLYYGWAEDGTVLFGSELSALRAHPRLRTEVDPDALALLLRLDYIPAPHSILQGVHKLQAGHLLRLDEAALRGGGAGHGPGDQQPWWHGRQRMEAAIATGFEGGDEDALDALDALLRDAVGLRMEADVPLGAFLSGGTDSSLVTALMQAQSPRPVRSFSIGFDNADHDESAHAAAVARHLGTEHTELHADGRAALDLVPDMASMFDEPFATPRSCPPPCCAGWRGATSPWPCPATAVMNCFSAMAATAGPCTTRRGCRSCRAGGWPAWPAIRASARAWAGWRRCAPNWPPATCRASPGNGSAAGASPNGWSSAGTRAARQWSPCAAPCRCFRLHNWSTSR